MVAKNRVTTNDLVIRFWDQSFMIDGIPGGTIWLGRTISKSEAGDLGMYFQRLVDRGRVKLAPMVSRAVVIEDDDLIQENIELKDTIDDLEQELESLKDRFRHYRI